MSNIKVTVQDANNVLLEVTPVPLQQIAISRGVAGRGIDDVQAIEIDNALYLEFFFTDGTTEIVGPVGTIQYIGESPIVVEASTISLSTVPVTLGGTGQITANAGFNALAPSQTGNAGKYLTTDGSNTSWGVNPLGTVTSVDMSVPTGLTISGNPITTSGTLAVGLQSGYSIPTTASQSNWDTAYSERQQWNGGSTNLVAATGRTSLGLGTIATQDASNVSITGGTITGITDLAVLDGGTGASTAAGAMQNLLPSYTGNANKRLSLDSTASGLEWVTDGGGTVTSIDVSGGSTGLLFSGGPITTSGTITLSGTLDLDNGGTGATTAADARTNLGAASSAITISAGTGLSGGGDLTANRTLSIANTAVTSGSYGSASNTLTATVNAQGQLTALAATPIAIANTQVSGLGTMSTQNSNAVTITGGSITGITDLAILDGGTGASTASGARSNLGLGTAAVLDAGVANGVATLDSGGTVPLSQIPASIQGGVSYQGSWNASTNTPTIVSGVGTKGYYYVVSVAGSTNIDGITDWLPGDWIIFNGTTWEQIDNTDAVASVNGYTGVVVLTASDVGAPPTTRTISAGTGLTGGGDLSTNRTISIANTAVTAASYGTASAVPSFTVNGQGQLTAASDVTIAISNTQVSGLGTMSTQNANSVAITGGSITGITDLAILDGGTGASTAAGALSNLGGIGTITSTDGSIVVTPSGTTVDLAVSAASPASTLLTQVRNTTGSTLAKGTVVYISGATGQIATVSKALATSDATSAQTLGMITSDLANNANGYVTVIGLLENIDTSAYSDGQQLYLSGTTAGAVTGTKPYAPIHLVYVAVVEYAHPTQGKLFVKVQNGYELDEIHNVSAQTPSNGQTIVYNSSNQLWENNTVSLSIGVNGTLPIANGGTGQTTANAAFNALAPSQTGNSGKYLTTDGSNTSWASNPLGTVTSVGGTGTVSGITLSGTVTTSGNLTLGGALDLSAYNGAGAFTTLSASSSVTLSGGTANGVTYLNGSKVLTSGSALTFDGTNLGVGGTASLGKINSIIAANTRASSAFGASSSNTSGYFFVGQLSGTTTSDFFAYSDASTTQIGSEANKPVAFYTNNSEGMRLTSTGLGIGTSSPTVKLDIVGTSGTEQFRIGNTTGGTDFGITVTENGTAVINSAEGAIGRGIQFQSGGTNTLLIDSAGNLGIGTSSPSSLLSGSNTNLTIEGTAGGDIAFKRSGGAARMAVGVTSGDVGYVWTSTNTSILFGVNASEQMRLTSTGLGIGTSSPSFKLDVRQSSDGTVGYFRRIGGTANPALKLVANETGNTVGFDTDYSSSSPDYTWSIGGTSVMRLTSAGNLGLGVTPSAWNANVRAFETIEGWASISGNAGNGAGNVASNAFFNTSGAWAYKNTAAASRYQQLSGTHAWFTAASGTAGNAISFTQAMTLDASGRLLVGNTTSGSDSYLTVNDGICVLNKSTNVSALYFGVYGTPTDSYSYIRADARSSGYLAFSTNNLERARIDSSGNLLVGKTSTAVSLLGVAWLPTGNGFLTTSDSGTQYPIGFYREGNSSAVGFISTTSSATTYATSSDYRLKNTIAPMTGALAKVAQLKPCTYKWNADGSDGEGFIAHELAEVVPQCVTGEKDAVDEEGNPKYQGIDTSFLVATLTAAIQELKASMDAVKAEFDAYKASHP